MTITTMKTFLMDQQIIYLLSFQMVFPKNQKNRSREEAAFAGERAWRFLNTRFRKPAQ